MLPRWKPVVVALCTIVSAIAPAQSLPTFAGPFGYDPGPAQLFPIAEVRLRDLDGDGRDDLFQVQSIFPAPSIRYRLANPNGTLGPRFELGSGLATSAVQTTDAGDGTPDVFYSTPDACPAPSFAGYLNGGRTCTPGGALSITPFGVSLPCPNPAVVCLKMVVSGSVLHAVVNPVGTNAPTVHTFSIQLPATPGGTPTISLLAPPYTPTGSNPIIDPFPCDLDGDGMPDLVLRSQVPFTSTTFEILRWTPAGFVSNTPTSFITLTGMASPPMVAHDLNGDGRDELLCYLSNGPKLYWNQGPQPGSGGGVLLTEAAALPQGFLFRSFDDIDGDGDVDILGIQANAVRALLNDGLGGFALSPIFAPAPGSLMDTGDIDGDGDIDIVTGGPTIAVFLNEQIPPTSAYPGTADGIVLSSAVHPPAVPPPGFTGAPYFDIKAGLSGGAIDLQLSAPQFAGSSAYLLIEVCPPACHAAFPFQKVYASFGSDTVVQGPFTVAGGGSFQTTIVAPPVVLPLNLSAIAQYVIPTPAAYNGAYAGTDAHEIQF